MDIIGWKRSKYAFRHSSMYKGAYEENAHLRNKATSQSVLIRQAAIPIKMARRCIHIMLCQQRVYGNHFGVPRALYHT